MKKILYITTALLALAACSKNELENTPSNTNGAFNIDLNITVNSTKAHFDGVDHIAFDSGDKLLVSIAKEDTPTQYVKLADQNEAVAKNANTKFKIEDPTASIPVFKGTLWSITEDNIADKYILYSACPAEQFSVKSLTNCEVTIPNDQKTTQTSWDKSANAMIGKITTIDASTKETTKYSEYNVSGSASIDLAHIFGFGKLTFAGVPEKYSKLKVNSVVISAIGEKKDISGTYYLDMTKDIREQDITSKTLYSSITVTPAESVSVEEAVIWFEANPGVYDVSIKVVTDRGDLIFERQNLKIERHTIAAPTVNYKETDAIKSNDVDLTDGEEWSMPSIGWNAITNSAKEWGPDGKKMKFYISWPNSSSYNAGTSYTRDDYSKVQGFNGSQKVDGGKIVFYSLSSFKGVKKVRINLGIYSDNASCDFTIALANGTDTTKLKTITVTTESGNLQGTDYIIDNTTEVKDGDFLLIMDNLSNNDIRPYLGYLYINPAPVAEIDLVGTLNIPAAQSKGDISCKVSFASVDPVVETDATWIKCSLANDTLTYEIEENTGAKRSGKIFIKVADKTIATIPVVQKSASEIEYKFILDHETMAAVIEKAKSEYVGTIDQYTYSTDYSFTVKATATDGSGKTIDVPMIAKNLFHEYSDTEFKIKYTLGTENSIGFIEKVVVVSSKELGTSTYSNRIELSAEGSSYPTATGLTVSGYDPYTSTIVNEDETMTWFRLNVDQIAFSLMSMEVTFVSE